jgi:hypothetical protein
MPIPLTLSLSTLFFVVALLFLTGLIGAAVLGSFHTWSASRERKYELVAGPASQRHCRYCRWGHAMLHEESVKFEDRDRVTVRCYVCNSCGLPQWFVHRVSMTKYAEY